VKPTIPNTLPGGRKCLHFLCHPDTEPSILHFTNSRLEAALPLTGCYLLETWTWNLLLCQGLVTSLILLSFVMLSVSQLILTLEHATPKPRPQGICKHPPENHLGWKTGARWLENPSSASSTAALLGHCSHLCWHERGQCHLAKGDDFSPPWTLGVLPLSTKRCVQDHVVLVHALVT